MPFAAFSKDNNFKLYLFDIGLLGALGDLSPNVIFMQNDLFVTFKGAFCENFVAQEFICKGQSQLYCWINNGAGMHSIPLYLAGRFPLV